MGVLLQISTRLQSSPPCRSGTRSTKKWILHSIAACQRWSHGFFETGEMERALVVAAAATTFLPVVVAAAATTTFIPG